ncbi:HAMP domain-containing sensor histidine kinase [Sphingomonas flavescens]|uniref:sensor histidine kinase n=1 Tax=Sphingomonas flavescens TaxID=3132797 RepID=UPI0028038217|nr:HAMP domain-containing sensor histidine kinase [Sphingomonas limnosediminicola]
MHIAFTRQLDSMVSDEAQTLVDEYHSGGDGELAEAIIVREASSSPTHMMYGVYAPDGRRIHGSFPAGRPSLGLQQIAFRDDSEGPDKARAMVVDLSPSERLVVAVDSDWLETIERIIIIIFSIAFIGACLLGFAGSVFLGSYLRRRLYSISHSAQAIIGGDIRKRMPVGANRDEFDELAATLNRMLDRIEGLLDNLRQVSSDIAHDLRTPLARLRNRLERGVSGDASAAVEEAISQVDDVLSLFAAILRIAEVEAGETRRFFRSVDLSALATELAESFAPSVEEQNRTLLWSVEPDIKVTGDRELLAQAFINLLENAQRHTPDGSIIRLTLVVAGRSACLSVRDNGPGVPTGDLPRITKRFARVESNRSTPGYGLGLSLADAVAKLHKGRLVLRNEKPGFSATVELPRLAGRPQGSRRRATSLRSPTLGIINGAPADEERLERHHDARTEAHSDKGPGRYAGVLDHQDPCDHARRDWRGHGHHDVAG